MPIYKKLQSNCIEALSVLGISKKNVYLGEFPDNEMDSCSRLNIIYWIENIVGNVQPSIILTHHRYCTNTDHQFCHEAVIVASRPNVNNHITVLCGEVPSSTGYLRPVNWEPNCYIELSNADIEKKTQAMMDSGT
jgi:N-acetylglucosamine malate deacetylase 1